MSAKHEVHTPSNARMDGMPVLPWKQGVHSNKPTMNYCRLKGPMYQI